jgi:hypothetical protein
LLAAILEQLDEVGGLNYCRREQTIEGRVLDHACDARILVKALAKEWIKELPAPTLTILLDVVLSQDDTVSEGDGFQLVVNRAYLDLNLKSNGKMQLYFHAYFWHAFISQLQRKVESTVLTGSDQLARLAKYAAKPKQVADMVGKYAFGEKEYQRFVEEFGGRKPFKKVKLIEELQRALFVAQIQENTEQLDLIEKLLIQLLGYKDIEVRDEAVIILNMLYDGIDWQLTSAFTPIIRCVGQHFKVNLVV